MKSATMMLSFEAAGFAPGSAAGGVAGAGCRDGFAAQLIAEQKSSGCARHQQQGADNDHAVARSGAGLLPAPAEWPQLMKARSGDRRGAKPSLETASRSASSSSALR